ncbi:Putative L-lysine 6-monooxygenase/L-ornithine 5-monooxygenase, FAD/NAD(P)-binding domain superfamily [Septoria linicola]|uniref:L-ornithine N(5)-monooxygenase [NAD(P)H] n=1 Tax=Septoria linicola TaxID=215465 RepID=A0A9Q9B6R1_9PEZI|nr:Putative L-lysine 6-monooxygenase/L-ornithine 5-monooxygenase, FAD/NAD(P)-binding domain superfamily [Septoria linicola]
MPASRADSMSPERDDILPYIYDTIIIGAGPCGLATAARLREHTPSAIFTDEEHHRYHWIKKHAGQAAIKNSKTGQTRSLASSSVPQRKSSSPSMLVLDSSGDSWMSKWKRLFSLLEISHLRSPMFFHPDPHDRDGLLAYAHAAGRECECIEIAGCVGKELSKHQMKKRRNNRRPGEQAKPTITIDERDRKDYYIPPSDLFHSYCSFIAERYNLQSPDLIQQASVSSIDYDYFPHLSPHDKIFTIKTSTSTHYARTAVLAVGAGNAPSIPKPFPQSGCPCACHAFQPLDTALSTRLASNKNQQTNILVIGGGLTSAQISDRIIRKSGSSSNIKVFHLMRGNFKVKPFDVDLSWMGKFRNHEKASFWSADTDEERSELIKSARGGGSITPRFAKILKEHVDKGRVDLHTNATVRGCRYDPIEQVWHIKTQPELKALEEAKIHYVYFATGVASDFETLPYLKGMCEKYPVESYDGLPALTDDLMWREDVPLFMTGKFAALRLGPGAGNLEGARLGAERIAWALQDFLGKDEVTGGGSSEDEESKMGGEYRFAAGIGSRYESLEVEG